MDPAELTPREVFGVLLQYPDPIPSVVPVALRAQTVTLAGGYWESGEGSRALLFRPRKSYVGHLGLVYCLDDWQLTPVDYVLGPVHSVAV